MKLNPYLTFDGVCREAMNFYKECLNGEIVYLQNFEDSPEPISEVDKKRVMHAHLKFGENDLMASDSRTEDKMDTGNNIQLSVNLSNPKEMEKIFSRLSKGGEVHMPIQDTFWGAKFGMLKDKYGIHWMFNCELNN
ncbi:VOC family protein [Xanthovirga aplysinae]|uniref:VOC family protein n=1 Tax=Xanthovirga aplysinae TaxID=2529853 RepID=UPI0012BD2B58|nr:glyoxalase/bleomycin resistance/extradiol dioxygenase family protein [Xanthovirga aplysinae]MTI29984.1 glyoxalase/bleomycin resistance/extradiol dioxygenase family protein [Xanthovirga aplysinae]